MNDDPHEVDVLYVKVTDDGKHLPELCKYLVDLFTLAGLAPIQERDVKLHATFINTKLREDEKKAENTKDGRGDRRREEQKERISIDATSILSSFGDVDLGSCKASGIEISTRGDFNSTTGYWSNIAIVKLP